MNRLFLEFRTTRVSAVWLLVLGLSVIPAPLAQAGSVSGMVTNGTTGKPAAGTEVILIQLQGGMQPVANTKTDASGHYSFENAGLGAGRPMLIRVVYRGVNYHEPVPPGKTTADVQVFEPTDRPTAFAVTNHALIVQPNGVDLMVGEEYSIENKTQPPVAFYRAEGSFDFSIPDGADFNQASAWGSAGMPVVQGTIDKGKNKMAIAFPFRPGESGVRISYKVPYPSSQITLKNVSSYSTDRLIIAAPPSVRISGEGITPAGQDQGFNVYTRSNVAADVPVAINVSGTAALPSSSPGAGEGRSSGPPDNSGSASVNSRLEASGAVATTVAATTVPARLDSLKWILVGGFASIFALGFVYLWRRPQVITSMNGNSPALAAPLPTNASVARAAGTPAASDTAAQVSREVRGSLDELKDSLFRLELRRQAGTITESDYERDRQHLEKVLRDLVRG
jgi:hypothetical protein